MKDGILALIILAFLLFAVVEPIVKAIFHPANTESEQNITFYLD